MKSSQYYLSSQISPTAEQYTTAAIYSAMIQMGKTLTKKEKKESEDKQ